MKFLTLLIILCSITANSQINGDNWDNWSLKSPEKEFMFLETHWDYAEVEPGNALNENKDIHYAIELGIRSNLGRNTFGAEVKIAYENFPNLLGGFKSFGGGFGPYWVAGGEEQIMYYIGVRIIPWVYRTNLSTGIQGKSANLGLELKWTYTFNELLYIGVRFNYDTANDMEIIDDDLTGETRWAGNLTLGWNITRIGAYKK
tara:strand:- start:26 stop:631 length:606 start_codon:yes stop_codon:yes gene_type:complete